MLDERLHNLIYTLLGGFMLHGGGTHVIRRGYPCCMEGVPMLHGGGTHDTPRGYIRSIEQE